MTSSPEQPRAATPWWFWAFAIALLLLSLAGVAQLPQQYLSSEEELAAQLPAATLTIMQAEPWWAATGYAVGLIAGLFGALSLLVRRTRKLVPPLLGLSIAGFLVQRAWFFLLSDLTHLLPPVASLTLFAIVGFNLVGIWMARREIAREP